MEAGCLSVSMNSATTVEEQRHLGGPLRRNGGAHLFPCPPPMGHHCFHSVLGALEPSCTSCETSYAVAYLTCL